MSIRLFLVASLALGGCLPSFALDGNGDGGAPADPGNPNPTPGRDGSASTEIQDLAPPPPDLAEDPVRLFTETVQPILVGADGQTGSCGACHSKEGGIGPGFLAPKPDVLGAVLSFPGLIGATPETSRLFNKGAHEGPAFTAVEKPTIKHWIEIYNLTRPKPDAGVAKPSVTPFAPAMDALNKIELGVLDPSLMGHKIEFYAKMVGTSLKLSGITITTTAAMGLHIVHPLWVTWSADGQPTPDPIDSFATLDDTIFAADAKLMGPGTLYLPGFASGMMVNLVFNLVEARLTGTADGGGVIVGCKNVASWQSNAQPQLTQFCTSCHAGGNGVATMAFSLVGGNGNATNCLNTLGNVNLTTPQSSRLYSIPSPTGNGHPFKFPADNVQFNAFKAAVDVWINAEK